MRKITLLFLLFVFVFYGASYAQDNGSRNPANWDTDEVRQKSLLKAAASSDFAKGGELILNEGFDDIELLEDDGWFMKNLSEPLGSLGWFQGHANVFTAWDGEDNAYIASNFNSTASNGTISNWLVTPEVLLKNGATFSFRTRSVTSSWEDRLEVRLSKDGESLDVGDDEFSVGVFQEVIAEVNPELDGSYPSTWTLYTITIEDLEEEIYGRFAFRYFLTEAGPGSTNGDYIGIDRVRYQLPQTYTVALFANPTAGGNVGGAGQYVESEKATITAVPNDGYMFTHWSNNIGDPVGPVSSTSAQFDYTVMPVDINLTAHFTNKIPAIDLSRENFHERLDEGYMVSRTLMAGNTGDADSKLDVRMHIQVPYTHNDPLSILFLHSMQDGNLQSITDSLLLLDIVDDIDVVSVINSTPELAVIQEYDIVIIATDLALDDSALLSSNLKSYVDAGGRLILMLGAILQGGGWALTEDIMSEDYSPLAPTSSYLTGQTSSTNFYAHPITESVGSISTFPWGTNSLQGEAISLGNLATGYSIGAYNPNKPVIAYNIFPRNGYWEGDLPKLLENSFKWLMTDISWVSLDKFSGEIASSEDEQFRLSFNAVDMEDGLYEAELYVYANDPGQKLTVLPVNLRVGAEVFTIELEASPQEGGTVSGSGEYEEGQTVNISASAQEGFRFVSWENAQENVISTDTEHSFTASENVKLTAIFESTTDVLPIAQGTLELYPNPSDGVFTLLNAQGFKLEVFNTAGQRVWYGQPLTANQQTVDLSALNTGVYILRLSNTRESQTLKLILE